ncbi:MAG: GNAT family N-acetyltransferase [Lachnospiraceae bacterium]|nr:GNAT family N-acetyltransferase [Lachnospiraceae bacterium]
MTISFRWRNGNDVVFHRLYLQTEAYYNSLVGGICNRQDYVPHNLSESISDVIITYVDGTAAGCAGLKAYSKDTVEIKRVWVDETVRGNHIAEEMMARVETRALEQGYKKAILQTRPQMEAAVSMYTKLEYGKIENYPPYDTYDKLDDAICFAKILTHQL